MKIGLASDHAGYGLKTMISTYLSGMGLEIEDYGSYSEESCDYPDFAHRLARAVESGEVDSGIAACGSGNGISITLNKHSGVRAALCWNPEIARLARAHNDANVLSLPARFIDELSALETVNEFLSAEYEGGRHQKRIDKIVIAE